MRFPTGPAATTDRVKVGGAAPELFQLLLLRRNVFQASGKLLNGNATELGLSVGVVPAEVIAVRDLRAIV